MATYRQWLLAQLRAVDALDADDDPQIEQMDGMRTIIGEAQRRAVTAGFPAAVEACEIRKGPLAPIAARKVLAACLAAIPDDPSGLLTVKQAAEAMGVSVDSIYDLCKSGRLPHQRIGRAIRVRPEDLDNLKAEAKRGHGNLRCIRLR